MDKSLTNLFPNKKTRINIIEITNVYQHADLLADIL